MSDSQSELPKTTSTPTAGAAPAQAAESESGAVEGTITIPHSDNSKAGTSSPSADAEPNPKDNSDAGSTDGVALPPSVDTVTPELDAKIESGNQPAVTEGSTQAAESAGDGVTPGQQSLHDEQAAVLAQIEAAANKLGGDSSDSSDLTGASAQAASASQPIDKATETTNVISGAKVKDLGAAIDLESGTAAPPKPGYEPASPYTPDPYAKQKHKKHRHGSKKLAIAVWVICIVLLVCIGVGAYSVWYVKTHVLSSVSYSSYQPVSVKGANNEGGFVLEVPAEYSQDTKNDDSIEYSHRVPSDKGEGNYSGIAVTTSKITDSNQSGQIDALKAELRNKDSEISQQFIAMINGSLSGQQVVTLDSYIEKSNATGQNFFGYNITLSQGENPVGKGWMLITTSQTHVYVLVIYGTDKVWAENTRAWQYVFDSLQVNPS